MKKMEKYLEIIKEAPELDVSLRTDTIASISNSVRKENFISNWIAYLICNSSDLLELIIALINKKIIGESINYNDENEYQVHREYVFENNKQIDILIESDDFLIGIENKIEAKFQDNQLLNYSEGLGGIGSEKKVVLATLIPKDRKKEVEHGVVITYHELLSLLKDPRIQTDDDRYIFFLKDFITTLEENYMKNIEKNDLDFLDFLNENGKKIKKLKDNISAINTLMVNQIKSFVIDLPRIEEEWCTKESNNFTYIQFYKNNWKNSETGIDLHFEVFPVYEKSIFPKSFIIRLDVEGNPKQTIGTDAKDKPKQIIANGLVDEINKKYNEQRKKDGKVITNKVILEKVVVGKNQNTIPLTKEIFLDYSSTELFEESLMHLKKVLIELVQYHSDLIEQTYTCYKENLAGTEEK